MGVWDNIRNYFYKKALEDKSSGVNVEHRVINLADAKTVGLLYDSTPAGNDTVVLEFAQQLRAKGKQVEILGYLNDKKIDTKDGVTIFNKKNISWYLAPNAEQADKFANTGFDLLMGCFTGNNLPLEFIATISKARWRVGVYNEKKTNCYDMMVNVGERTELPYLIQQTTHFLNQIKYDSK